MLDLRRASDDERAILAAYPDVICTTPESFSYQRVSTAAQLLGDSPRRQTSQAEEAAKKVGLPLNRTLNLNDGGVSAFTGDNLTSGFLFAFITLAKYGRIAKGSCLILDALDRFSRDEPLVAVGPYRDILMADISIFSCSDNRFHDHKARGMDSVMMLIISLMQFGTANQESSTKSYRINESWIGRRAKAEDAGKAMTTLCPGWLRYDEKAEKFVPIPHRVRIVERIFTMAAEGAGKRTIAKTFAHEETWGLGKRKGRMFYESYVHKLLNDRRVLGEFQPGTNPKKKRGLKKDGKTPRRRWEPVGDPIADYYPRIISDKLWWKVRHVRDKNKGMGGGNPEAFRSLFRGLTFCGCCTSAHGKPVGMAFVSKGKGTRGGHDKLVCSQAMRSAGNDRRLKKGMPVCAHIRRYRYADLERNVLFGFGKSARDLLGHENQRRGELEKAADVIESRIAGLKKQQAKWVAAIDGDTAAPKAVMAKLASIEADVEAAEREHQAALIELNATPARSNVGQRLSELMKALKERETVDDRRRLNEQLRRHIRNIVFAPNKDGTATVTTTFADGKTAKWFLPEEDAPDPEETAFMKGMPAWPKTRAIADEVLGRRLETRGWVKLRRLNAGWRAGRL